MGLTHCYKTTVFLHLFKYSTTSPELTLNQSINCSDPNRYRSIAPDLNPNEFAAEPKWICGWGRVLVFATVDNCWSFTNVQRSSRSLSSPQIFSSISFYFQRLIYNEMGRPWILSCPFVSCPFLFSGSGRDLKPFWHWRRSANEVGYALAYYLQWGKCRSVDRGAVGRETRGRGGVSRHPWRSSGLFLNSLYLEVTCYSAFWRRFCCWGCF